MDKISAVMQRFPQYAYNKENIKSTLYKLIEAIIKEFNITVTNIDKLDAMLDINRTLPDDLYNRWGALLNIKQNIGETDEQYRERLKVSVTSLSGGTAEAIKYAVACGLGINNDSIAMDRIKVYDAWKYDGDGVDKDYGYIVCDVDLNYGDYSIDIENIVKESANNVKAGGTVIQFIYRNFRLIYYLDLDNVTYASLNTLIYNKVGE